jgi:hypothetical protein
LRPEDFCDTNSIVPITPDDTPPSDFAAALGTTMRIRSWLVLLLLLVLLGELTLFFLYRYVDAWQPRVVDLLKYCMGVIEFAGVCMGLLLMVDLLVALNIVLAGRLGGAVHLVRALVWSTIAAILLFPWQAFLANEQFTSSAFKIPGVLYTWQELTVRARWNSASLNIWQALLFWARFVGFPAAAVVVLAAVQFHSGRARGSSSKIGPTN